MPGRTEDPPPLITREHHLVLLSWKKTGHNSSVGSWSWTEIGDIVQRAPAQTMGWTLNTMIVLQEAGGGVCEPWRGVALLLWRAE